MKKINIQYTVNHELINPIIFHSQRTIQQQKHTTHPHSTCDQSTIVQPHPWVFCRSICLPSGHLRLCQMDDIQHNALTQLGLLYLIALPRAMINVILAPFVFYIYSYTAENRYMASLFNAVNVHNVQRDPERILRALPSWFQFVENIAGKITALGRRQQAL